MTDKLAALSASLLIIGPILIREPAWDKLYFVVLAATLYLIWLCLTTRSPFQPGNRWFGNLGVRFALLLVLCLLAGEFYFRTRSMHRTLYYERQGDLLFTPLPNQDYVEKISMTRSWTDKYGMRQTAPPLNNNAANKVLCLGDSITYGYGLSDSQTYPSRLQTGLDLLMPGKWKVWNGGVNAYPMSFIHQRFLYLWNLGVRPDFVIVGYSMNEGWLGSLTDADEQTKRSFGWRVFAKNRVRESALYNIVMENWARLLYDRLRLKLVPGTHSVQAPAEQTDMTYERTLTRFVNDLRSRNVRPVFAAFASLDGYTMHYDTEGPLQKRFIEFASRNGIPLIRSEQALAHGSGKSDISGLFQDPGHMNPSGADIFGNESAHLLTQLNPHPDESPSAGLR